MNSQAATLHQLTGGPTPIIDRGRPRAIAITGGKGGVGKSTLALNLAVSYARRGSRTLTVDGDLGMADLNLLTGLAPHKSLLDVLNGDPIASVLVAAHGITLLPALNGSHHLANLNESERRVILRAIDSLLGNFDTVVVDTPAGIGSTAMELTASACDVVVVTTPEPLALADAYACLKVLATRQGLKRAFVLPNVVRTPSQAEEVVARLRALCDRFLGIELLPLPAIPHDATVASAAAAGVPLVIHSPEAPAARAIRRAARHIDALSADSDRTGDRLRLHINGGQP